MSRRLHAPRLLLVVLAALAMLAGAVVPQAGAREDLDAEAMFVDLINAERTGAGLGALQPAADVRQVALAWSNAMADARTMSHNPRYHEQFCCWLRAAENVGWTTVSDLSDPAKVRSAVERLHRAFMESEGHRANIMHPSHDHIGLAIELRADSCPAGTQIRDCMWVTENFRHWDGTQPAGGLADPYAGGSRTGTDSGAAEVAVSDDVHDGGFDGNTETVERLGRAADSALQVARARFGSTRAAHAVLARDDRFPDSLAGSPLTADGPLLYTPSDRLLGSVRDELRRVLPAGATVYLLGGEAALSRGVLTAVRDAGFRPLRLAGSDRVGTSLAIADEVRSLYGDNGNAAVARGWGLPGDPDGTAAWVDSITGGAWAASRGVPVLISPTGQLPSSVDRWLDRDAPGQTFLFGGEAALSESVRSAVPRGVRIWGADRALTAAAVARQLWGVSPEAPDREFVVIDGWDRAGWRHGLAAAGLSSDQDAPMLLTRNDGGAVPAPTSALVGACTTSSVDLLLVGGLLDSVAGALESLDGRTC